MAKGAHFSHTAPAAKPESSIQVTDVSLLAGGGRRRGPSDHQRHKYSGAFVPSKKKKEFAVEII